MLAHRRNCFSRRRQWWSQTGSNRRPPACKAGALPTELWPRMTVSPAKTRGAEPRAMVGLGRLERPTSRLSGVRSNHLSYRPDQFAQAPCDAGKRNEDGGIPPCHFVLKKGRYGVFPEGKGHEGRSLERR